MEGDRMDNVPNPKRRQVLVGAAGLAAAAVAPAVAAAVPDAEALRAAHQRWRDSLPVAPAPELARHGLVATELGRWHVIEARQAAAVDAGHFYGIGNHNLVRIRKDTGERVAEWVGPRGGPIVHFNAGYVDDGELVLAHSNFPHAPMVSSVEVHDARTLQPLRSYSLGLRAGSLTWAVRHQGCWWACFANYNSGRGGTPGIDQRWTYLAEFDDNWQMLRSWIFPPQVVATWGDNSSSGGDWGDDGLLYVTGHDAAELYVLRLPSQGSVLEYITTIDVPFEGQGWAWDRSLGGDRVIYGIIRTRQEIVSARIPVVPRTLLA